MSLQTTASQTVGPFFRIGMEWLYRTQLTADEGTPATVTGRVLDGEGRVIPDAVIEIWQADAHGRYHHPEDLDNTLAEKPFDGFLRVPTDDNGSFRFTTIKPGPVSGPSDTVRQAPHLNVSVLMRGLLKRMPTRMYFPGEAANRDDPILALVPEDRRSTLIARAGRDNLLNWDINMQGDYETVFFDF